MIVAADIHLRSTIPRCRAETKEEWIYHQLTRVFEMIDYAAQYDKTQTIGIAGDIFHYAVNSEEVVRMISTILAYAYGNDVAVFFMAGNHDLLYRQQDSGKSTYDILKQMTGFHPAAGEFDLGVYCSGGSVSYVPYGEDKPVHTSVPTDFLFLHTLTFKTEDDVPYGVTHYETAESLLAKYPEYKYIVVGDQHRGFLYEKDDRYVINCGCMTAQSTTEIDYPHGFYHIADDGIKHIPFKHPMKLVEESILKQEQNMDANIMDMTKKLSDYSGKTIDYEEKLRNKLTSSKVSSSINSIVIHWIQEVGNEKG